MKSRSVYIIIPLMLFLENLGGIDTGSEILVLPGYQAIIGEDK